MNITKRQKIILVKSVFVMIVLYSLSCYFPKNQEVKGNVVSKEEMSVLMENIGTGTISKEIKNR